nr:MAG TPA: hypothetical protein [Caudoviricetes sp.]
MVYNRILKTKINPSQIRLGSFGVQTMVVYSV